MFLMTRVFSLAAGTALAISVGMASASTIAPNDADFSITNPSTLSGLNIARERTNRVPGGSVFGSYEAQPGNSSFGASTAAATQNGGGSNMTTSDDLSSIPLPAAGWLLLAALGGLGLTARRRKTL